MFLCPKHMVRTGPDESKLRTFQGPFQDQISHYKDFYGEFHNADIPNAPHICGNFLLFSFWDITSDLIGHLFNILKENWQNVDFGIGCLLNLQNVLHQASVHQPAFDKKIRTFPGPFWRITETKDFSRT